MKERKFLERKQIKSYQIKTSFINEVGPHGQAINSLFHGGFSIFMKCLIFEQTKRKFGFRQFRQEFIIVNVNTYMKV